MAAPGTIPNTPRELLEATAGISGTKLLLDLIRLSLAVLADRIFLWVSLLGTFALFGYAMWQPTMLRLGIAIAYTLLSLTPQLVLRGKESGRG